MAEASSGAKLSQDQRKDLKEIKTEISRLKDTLKATRDGLKMATERRDALLKQAGRERKAKKA